MLKNLIFILFIACLATSCSSTRPTTAAPSAGAKQGNTPASSGSSVQFISNIAIKSDGRQDKTGSSISTVNISNTPVTRPSYASGETIENYPALQFKYAILENCSVEDLDNAKLLSFIDYWYGTPYHYGGTTRDGIDCSAFAFLLVSSVYGISALPRTSKEQYDAIRHIHRDELQEGDMVFFHTLGKHRTVTHVGIYLRNNKFIHASVSGVMISDMSDGYYNQHFVGAGRVLNPQASRQTQRSAALIPASSR